MADSISTQLDDDIFRNYASNIQDTNKPKTPFTPRQYEEVEWLSLDGGINKVFRIIGNPPGISSGGGNEYDPIEIVYCDIKDQEGKRMQLRLPKQLAGDPNNHIVHRLYNKITEVEWINGQKIAKYETKHADLYKLATKSYFNQEKDGKTFQYSNGLKGSNVVLFNVIDRSDSWCAENKHTKLLSKNVSISYADDGTVRKFPQPGVSMYAFMQALSEVMKIDGNYMGYDVVVKRMEGQKLTPYKVKNASKFSKYPEMLSEITNDDGSTFDASIIKSGPITEEESKYAFYKVKELYKPTSYHSIQKRLGQIFKLADACLGTDFERELISLVEIEQKEFEERRAEAPVDVPVAQATAEQAAIQEAVVATTPVVEQTPPTRSAVAQAATGQRIPNLDIAEKTLVGWSKLSEEDINHITEVVVENGVAVGLKYDVDLAGLAACEVESCKKAAPFSYRSCPFCGLDFA